MDVDPLADVPPPRYAIESDDEDEAEGTSGNSRISSSVDVEITFKVEGHSQPLEKHSPLIVASCQAGTALAQLLGHPPPISSRVYANSIEIGCLAQLSSQRSKYTILISESELSQGILPLGYMHSYAQKVIDELEPSRISILDTYSHPTYASSDSPKTVYDAPVRYLLDTCSEDAGMMDRLKDVFNASPAITLETFSPPNLVNGTSAAFMNIVAVPRHDDKRTSTVLMLLLPSPHVGLLPSMRPRYLGEVEEETGHFRRGIPRTDYFEDELPWSSEMLSRVVKGLFVSDGRGVGGDLDPEDFLQLTCSIEHKGSKSVELKGKERRYFGEDGMYI